VSTMSVRTKHASPLSETVAWPVEFVVNTFQSGIHGPGRLVAVSTVQTPFVNAFVHATAPFVLNALILNCAA